MNELINIADSHNGCEPIVSVVCTAYNQKDFIKDTLEGFLIQKTSFPVEIIIHDDASTDGTREIIREYEIKYPNIIIPIYQKENQYSQKTDISTKFIYPLIRGKYVALCEGDDYWTDPLKLQKQVDFLEQNKDYGLVYTEIDRVNREGELIDQKFFRDEPTAFCKTFEDYLVHAPFRAPCTWLFRRNLYKGNNDKYKVGDFPMLLDIVANSKIHKIEDTTAKYRVLDRSASHFISLKHSYAFMKGIFEIQMDYALKYNVSKNVIEAIKIKHALESYNFAVTQNDINQIKFADKLLIGHPGLSCKFKVVQLLSKFKLGRKLVKYRLNRLLGYS